MTQELAKQLYEAGFPYRWFTPQDYDDGRYVREGIEFDNGARTAFSPTLSELIEECRDGFSSLYKTSSGWVASGVRPVNGGTENNCSAATPEEAVAKLWLWINLNK